MQMTRKTIGTTLGLLAPVLAIVTVVLWFRMNSAVGIPEDRTIWIVFSLLALAMSIASFVLGTRWFGGVAAVIGIFPALLLPATIAISKQEVAEEAIRVGDTIPYFVAVDDQGDRFTSDALAGTPVVIKFFRAHW